MKLLIKNSVLVVVLGFFLNPNARAESPNDFIQTAVDELASELDGKRSELADDKPALYAMIDKILLPRFDRQYAAQLVLGRHWRTASADQRDRFIDAFYGSLVRRYGDGVLEFDENQVKILPFRGDDSKKRATVRVEVQLDDGTRVPISYGLVQRSGGWQMFDVTIEGISYVRNYRTELNSEIQATSLDAVIERLEGEM